MSIIVEYIFIAVGFVLGVVSGYFFSHKKLQKSYGTLYIDDNGTMNIKFTAPWSELFAQKSVSIKIDIPDMYESTEDSDTM